jgi:hypothetical protein
MGTGRKRREEGWVRRGRRKRFFYLFLVILEIELRVSGLYHLSHTPNPLVFNFSDRVS